MAYAISPYEFIWTGPARPYRTVSAASIPQVFDVFFTPRRAAVVANNEIPIYGATQQIRSLLAWGENWDGAGAVAVSGAAVARAIALVSETFVTAYSVWSNPNVTASPYGEVVLEWWNNEKKLTIYVSNNQSDYVKVWGADIDKEMDDGTIAESHIGNLLMWLET
jgi:hypothetical protein